MPSFEAYFDGCCEPVNPGGTAAYGAVVFEDKRRVWQASEIFDPGKIKTSNNIAEYAGFIAILDYMLAREAHEDPIIVFGDSKLVICQMFGDPDLGGRKWRMRRGLYMPFAIAAEEKLGKFTQITGQWISRDFNTIADELSKARLKNAGVEFRIQPE